MSTDNQPVRVPDERVRYLQQFLRSASGMTAGEQMEACDALAELLLLRRRGSDTTDALAQLRASIPKDAPTVERFADTGFKAIRVVTVSWLEAEIDRLLALPAPPENAPGSEEREKRIEEWIKDISMFLVSDSQERTRRFCETRDRAVELMRTPASAPDLGGEVERLQGIVDHQAKQIRVGQDLRRDEHSDALARIEGLTAERDHHREANVALTQQLAARQPAQDAALRSAAEAFVAFCDKHGFCGTGSGDRHYLAGEWWRLWGNLRAALAAPEPAKVGEQPTVSSRGVGDIAQERAKQRAKWGDAHDDRHSVDQLLPLNAALLAVQRTGGMIVGDESGDEFPDDWGLVEKHKNDRRRQLVIAGALIAAEIDRLDRATGKQPPAKVAEPEAVALPDIGEFPAVYQIIDGVGSGFTDREVMRLLWNAHRELAARVGAGRGR